MASGFHPAKLSESQIATLADHCAAKIITVDANAVIGLVTNVGMRLISSLDIGADAPVPEQVDRSAQDRADDLIWRERRGVRCQSQYFDNLR